MPLATDSIYVVHIPGAGYLSGIVPQGLGYCADPLDPLVCVWTNRKQFQLFRECLPGTLAVALNRTEWKLISVAEAIGECTIRRLAELDQRMTQMQAGAGRAAASPARPPGACLPTEHCGQCDDRQMRAAEAERHAALAREANALPTVAARNGRAAHSRPPED